MGATSTIIVPGDDCDYCWAAGETPTELTIFLGGISMGNLWHSGLPVPPNDFFTLTQHETYPCRFENLGATYEIYLQFTATVTMLSVYATGLANIFRHAPLTPCEQYFVNEYTEPPDRFYAGGFAYVTTMEGLTLDIEEVMTINRDTVRYEVTPGPDRLIDVRVADTFMQQNMLVQLDKS